MNANRILMFWMYYIISIFVVVCLAFILKKVKIVRWQFFYPGQQEWAKINEEKIDKLCKRFLLLICIIYSLLIIVPSTLDLPYVLSKNYKTVQGVVSEKKGMFICVNDNNKKYRVGRVDWLKEGDAVNIIYLPFTKYATITKWKQ